MEWVLILPVALCLNLNPCTPQVIEVAAHFTSQKECLDDPRHREGTYCVTADALHGITR